jgi:hypothetical protein
MDIIRIAKPVQNQIKVNASFRILTLKQKFFLILFLFSFTTIILPHITFAAVANPSPNASAVLVFDISNQNSYENYLASLNQQLNNQVYSHKIQTEVLQHQLLTEKVKEYLLSQGSPLADYTETLINLKNWKKIVALASAESSICRNYPINKSNCWGVGGGNGLWNMGSNLGQAVITMNKFLNTNPKGAVKYSQMNFEQMNGIYKKPAAQHWQDNAQGVYQDLSLIESSIKQN